MTSVGHLPDVVTKNTETTSVAPSVEATGDFRPLHTDRREKRTADLGFCAQAP